MKYSSKFVRMCSIYYRLTQSNKKQTQTIQYALSLEQIPFEFIYIYILFQNKLYKNLFDVNNIQYISRARLSK